MQYWLEHHAKFTRHAVQYCYSFCNYATLCLVTLQLSCSSTFSLLKSGIDLYQVNSKFLPISSETLCVGFCSVQTIFLCESKQRLSRVCVAVAAKQMFDMLEKKRGTLHLYLLMTRFTTSF